MDYHSKFVQVCVVSESGDLLLNRRCRNGLGAVRRLIDPCWSVRRVAIESCCGAADFAERLIREAGWRVSLAHPGFVNRMKSSPDKTDYADARMLAELCRAGFLPEVWLAPEPIRDLRAAVKYRASLVDRRKAVKTQILGLLRNRRIPEPRLGRWSIAWRAWLAQEPMLNQACRWMIDEQLAELKHIETKVRAAEHRLRSLTADDPVVARLRSLKGVGLISACVIRAFIGRFDRFRNGKQLARFCALTPRNVSSGERVADAGLIRAGEPVLKTVLIQVAHSLRRWSPRWRAMGRRLEDKGKARSVVIGAIANRWVRWLHHEMLRETPVS